jgi:hypothetical protein
MKTMKHLSWILLAICPALLTCQTIYTYPLTADFSSVQAGGPDLLQIPNNGGATGEFTTRVVPASTCGQGGSAGGYFFEDDAGLQFNNPEGFIDQTYSLALNFQIDEFISPPGWVRLLSFTHYDDVGMYIKLTNPPTNGTLEFWPYGTAGQTDFFNTTDFYQMILVRSANGTIKVYINGQEFAEYDDSGTQAFLPGPPNNFIVFFRDDPSVLANEASPGFVSSIIIRNLAWTPQEVETVWENFCSSLLAVPEIKVPSCMLFPNPAQNGQISFQLPDNHPYTGYQILNQQGQVVLEGNVTRSSQAVDISRLQSGIYLIMLKGEKAAQTLRFLKM